MSQRSNASWIGAFVLGAILLATAAVAFFGSRLFWERGQSYVLYFPSSVKGLDVGAPVVFRGVRVGSVSDIRLQFDAQKRNFRIPVLINIDPKRIYPSANGSARQAFNGKLLQELIDQGLRAQLQLQSLVTGKLLIQLDFYPGKQAHLLGLKSKYPELPTIPSDLEELTRSVEKLPVSKLVENLSSVMARIDKLLASPQIDTSLKNVHRSLNQLQQLLQQWRQQSQTLSQDLHRTLNSADRLFTHLDQRSASLQQLLQSNLQQSRQTLQSLQGALQKADTVLQPQHPLQQQLQRTLEELAASARSLKHLSDYLQRHPEALLRGKTAP